MNNTQKQIRQLIKTLSDHLYQADLSTGKDRTQSITKASKTVADLEKLGVSVDKAFQMHWEGLASA